MPDQYEKLKETVKELEDELHSIESMNDQTRAVLHEVVQEIRQALHEDDSTELHPQSIRDRLKSAAREFEDAHPRIAEVINRLVDGLAQMGI